MYYYIALVLVLSLVCYSEYDSKRKDYINSKKLNHDFNEWLFNKSKKVPSNALFTELYNKRYGKEEHPQEYLSIQGVIIKKDTANIVASFPTKHPMLFETEQYILDNLESYYELEFEKVKDIKFWIGFILSAPVKILKHIGINEDHLFSKLVQVIFWFLSLFWLPIRSLIVEFIDFVIRNKIG